MQSSSEDIVAKLAKAGPVKTEPTPRRVRGVLGGQYVFDTIGAAYVWEVSYYPQFYIPHSDIKGLDGSSSEVNGAKLSYKPICVKAGDKTITGHVFTSAGPLKDLVRFNFKDLDAWYVEDEPIYSHPKDPYKRIECVSSSRTVRIEVDGHVVAESSNNVFLFETGLRPRYYLSPTAVDRSMMTPSDTHTYCPYKGEASYYHLTVKGRRIDDAIWWYRYPTAESNAVASRLCFYNEKVDVFIDGVKEK